MKYNIECMREIMLALENKLEISMTQKHNMITHEELVLTLENFSAPEVLHHLEILDKSDYIIAEPQYGDGTIVEYVTTAITPQGYEFLDSVRDNTAFGKLKSFANEHKGDAFSFLFEKFKALF